MSQALKTPYMSLPDGDILPYNETIANFNGVKLLAALPSEYSARMKQHKADTIEREQERQAYKAQFNDEQVALKRKILARKSADLSVGDAQREAQQDLESETGSEEFVVSTATKPQLVRYAKKHLNIDLDKSLPVADLREEVGMLLGLSKE
jgi:hypothetical protein